MDFRETHHLIDLISRDLYDRAYFFREQTGIGTLWRDIQLNIQATATRKRHFEECHQQATI